MPSDRHTAVSASTTRTGVHQGWRPARLPTGPPTLSLSAATRGSSVVGCTGRSPPAGISAARAHCCCAGAGLRPPLLPLPFPLPFPLPPAVLLGELVDEGGGGSVGVGGAEDDSGAEDDGGADEDG